MGDDKHGDVSHDDEVESGEGTEYVLMVDWLLQMRVIILFLCLPCAKGVSKINSLSKFNFSFIT